MVLAAAGSVADAAEGVKESFAAAAAAEEVAVEAVQSSG